MLDNDVSMRRSLNQVRHSGASSHVYCKVELGCKPLWIRAMNGCSHIISRVLRASSASHGLSLHTSEFQQLSNRAVVQIVRTRLKLIHGIARPGLH